MAFNDSHPGADNYFPAIERYKMANALKSKTAAWLAGGENRQALVDFMYSQNGNFFNNMVEAFHQWGALTERQENAIRKIMGEKVVRKAEYAAQASLSNYIGEVGQRLDFVLTVKTKISMETDFGTMHITILNDNDGNIVLYKGKYVSANKGDVVKTKATIKSHNTYEGAKQTMISRPKFENIIPEA